MDVVNAIFNSIIDFLNAFAEIFNKLPWGEILNSLLAKLMVK